MIIWLASYPRSGNTFLRVILTNVFDLETYSIYDDKSDIGKDAATSSVVGHQMLPDDFDLEAARSSKELFLIKTHDFVDNTDDKVIYLVRDGRQSSVSYRHYRNTFVEEGCEVCDVLYGNVPFGTWGEHVSQWNPRNRENTLTLKFEELTASPHSFLAQISEFIGVEIKTRDIPGFEELHEINPRFFRQGKSDTWKQELTERHLLIFWLDNISAMREIYPEHSPPELFGDTRLSGQFSELSREKGRYFQSVVIDLRKQLQERDEKLHTLNRELKKTRNQLNSIRKAISNLVDVKGWKSPVRKYREYKNLLETYFSFGG